MESSRTKQNKMLELLKCDQGSYIECTDALGYCKLIFRVFDKSIIVKNPKSNQTMGFITKSSINQIGFRIFKSFWGKEMSVKFKWKEINMLNIQTAAKY